jgi:chaperone protein EcpD
MNAILRNLLVAAGVACGCIGHADASVVVNGTRVLYPSSEREVTVKVQNTGATPALVQAWIDTGDADASPDLIDVPFVLTPAMFRLDPAKGQTMRLIYSRAPLPQDKETLFWLNVLEVPPKAKNAEGGVGNQIQLAIRTRIKLIFRPEGLPGRASEAPSHVRWEVAPVASGYRLKATNPTAYHVNLGRIELLVEGQSLDAGAGFVSPGSSKEFDLVGLTGWPKAAATVQYIALNDYGAGVRGEAPLGSTPTR